MNASSKGRTVIDGGTLESVPHPWGDAGCYVIQRQRAGYRAGILSSRKNYYPGCHCDWYSPWLETRAEAQSWAEHFNILGDHDE